MTSKYRFTAPRRTGLRMLAYGLTVTCMPHIAAAQELDLSTLTISQAREAIASGEATAEGLTSDFLERIRTYEPFYNAFTFMNTHALDDARALDARISAGENVGPLAGVPVVIKEAMDVEGLPSTAGWEPLSGQDGGVTLVPSRDAPVVARLRAAGAVILGKTNIPAFSNDPTRANSSWAGPTFNAVNRSIAPGASSSGTATAVSGGFAVAGLAEETGGSIQNPAAAQSLVGVKPSFGLVPNVGVVPLGGSTRDVIGPLAKTVRDAAIMLDVLAGYTAEDPKTVAAIGNIPEEGYEAALDGASLDGVRIGLYGSGWREEPLSDEARSLYDAAISDIEGMGATLVEDPFAGTGFADLVLKDAPFDARGMESLPWDLNAYLQRLGPDAAATSVEELRSLLPVDPLSDTGLLGQTYADLLPLYRISRADPTSPPNLAEFARVRTEYLDQINRVMIDNDLDVLVFPQSSGPLPAIFGEDPFPSTTVSEINIAGVPAVIVPAGRYKNGSPFSLIFIGPMWSEAQLLSYAAAWEEVTDHRIVPELEATKYSE